MVPDSTPPRSVRSQLASLPPVGIFSKFLFNLHYLFAYFQCPQLVQQCLTLEHLNKAIIYFSLFYSFIRSFVHSFIRSFVHSFIRSFVHSFIRSFVHSFIRSFVHSFIRSFVHSFIRSFVHSFIRSFVHSFIRSFVHSFIRSFVHSFIRSFVHSFIHLRPDTITLGSTDPKRNGTKLYPVGTVIVSFCGEITRLDTSWAEVCKSHGKGRTWKQIIYDTKTPVMIYLAV